ncbi:hypothetical protein [Microbacterium sp. NPDC057650]|uniref:hypothetical protein n=1 Tax=unclassified Microbacterium TaxID=2609290 RepID=UPI00366B8CF0
MGENDEADADAAGRAESEARLTSWVRKTTDKVPTGWIITGAGAILLGATAAFGGLAPQEQPKPVEISAGESYTGSQLDMTVVSAGVGGYVRGSGVTPEEGQRTLVVVLDVTNEFDEPRPTGEKDALGGIGVDGMKLAAPSRNRVADGSSASTLQPGVPTRVQLAWVVDADAVSAGDEIRVTLPDATHYQASFVGRGGYWYDFRTGAYVTVPVEALPEEETP